MNETNVNIQIEEIFENNKMHDLKRFIKKRQTLNSCNVCMSYLYYFVQSVSILTSTIGTGYNVKELIWAGIGVNVLATLVHSYEQINNNLSIKLLKNIENIRKNNYIDEDVLVDLDEDNNRK